MIRSFDLAMNARELALLMNDPHIKMISCKVRCSETGYTTVNVRYQAVKEPIERKRPRLMGRFILFNGANHDLNNILTNESTKLVNQHEFITEQGVIIVIDYEVKKERS